MSHILIVGGTGMLRGVSLYFAAQDNFVSVIARSTQKLENLKQEINNEQQVHTASVDYCDDYLLKQEILEVQKAHGSIDTAICWIHDVAPNAHKTIIESLSRENGVCRYFHILGSSRMALLSKLVSSSNPYEKLDYISYRTIVLGAMFEDTSYRWLTDDEISQGVVDCVQQNRKSHIIGEIPYQ